MAVRVRVAILAGNRCSNPSMVALPAFRVVASPVRSTMSCLSCGRALLQQAGGG